MSIIKDKFKTKDGRQYRFKVYYHNAENKLTPYVSKRFLTMKEAKKEEQAFILNKKSPLKKKVKTVVTDYFNDLKTRVKESTYITYNKKYKNNIKPYFENKYIDEIKVLDIENWKKELIKKLSVKSANQMYSIFREIFNFANKKYELNYNPVEISGRIKINSETKKEKLKYITYEEFLKFKSHIETTLFKCLFSTLYLTGVRKGELQALTWNDIDFENKTITINKSVSFLTNDKDYKITSTKNYLTREIAMNKSLIEELKKYHEDVKKYFDYKDTWFVFGNGDIIKDYQINNVRKKAFKDAKIKEITNHEFRHSHVSLCINEYLKSGQNDANKFMVIMSQRMGHSINVMQSIYLHLFPETQNKVIDLLDNL